MKFLDNVSEEKLKELYQLYLNVKKKSLALNTYQLPFKLFKKFNDSACWELIQLDIKPEYVDGKKSVTGFMGYSFKSETGCYCIELVGIDYELNQEFSCYRMGLYQLVKRSKELNMKKLHLGMTASVEKRKVGAKQTPLIAFIQADSNFNFQIIDNLSQ